jgi:hypothetical protein
MTVEAEGVVVASQGRDTGDGPRVIAREHDQVPTLSVSRDVLELAKTANASLELLGGLVVGCFAVSCGDGSSVSVVRRQPVDNELEPIVFPPVVFGPRKTPSMSDFSSAMSGLEH